MKKYEENMFAEYEEIKSAWNGNIVSFSKKEYVRLNSTLDILEIGGYICNLNIESCWIRDWHEWLGIVSYKSCCVMEENNGC